MEFQFGQAHVWIRMQPERKHFALQIVLPVTVKEMLQFTLFVNDDPLSNKLAFNGQVYDKNDQREINETLQF